MNGADQTRPPASEDDAAAEQQPLGRFALRFRVAIGVAITLVGLGLAIGFAVAGPATAGLSESRATVVHVAGVAIWAFIAGVGVTWAVAAPRWVMNLCAVLALVSYGVVWVAGL